MGRLLFFLLIAYVVYLLVRSSLRKREVRDAAASAQAARAEDMVSCARCGVHLPRSEAQEENGRLVCRDNPRCRAP